jgi:hypothetical protein
MKTQRFRKPFLFHLHPLPSTKISSQLQDKGRGICGSAKSQVYKNKAHTSALKCVRQRLACSREKRKCRGSQENQEAMLLSQLLGTLSCILLTPLISINVRHIQPSPAMNENLEGALFSVLRKKPFDKVVMDARQSRWGWVRFLDWHYTFMMQTNEEARAQAARSGEGPARGTGGWVGFDLGALFSGIVGKD